MTTANSQYKANYFNKILWVLLAAIYFFLFHSLLAYIISSTTLVNPLRLGQSSLYIEPLTMLILFTVLVVFTRRTIGTLVLVSVCYIFFMLINIEKIVALGVPVYPIDLVHSLELVRTWEVFKPYFPGVIMALLLLGLLLFLMQKEKKTPFFGKHLLTIRILTVGMIFAVVMNHDSIAKSLVDANMAKGQSYPLKGSEKNGFLFTFIYRVLKSDKPDAPANYNYHLVKSIFQKYQTESNITASNQPNVIIFFIESFTDPRKLGLKTSFDPIPNFRAISEAFSSGEVISPVIGGRSANAEFELLTGLSLRFVTEGSIPYIDLMNQPKPSIVNEFKNNGYETNAIHVASLGYFNYQVAYPNMGFTDISTTLHDPQSTWDPAERYSDDISLINKITTMTEREQPQFIFAFPNSTHGPWNYPAYLNSDLDVEGSFFEEGKKEIKTYVNAIHSTDKAIKKLINYYEAYDEDTVILIMGDHQPSLPEYRQNFMIENHLDNKNIESQFSSRQAMVNHFKKIILNTDKNTLLLNHRVPYVVWSNFNSPQFNQNLSMNLLGAKLLKLVQVKTTPLYNLLIEMSDKIEELSMLVKTANGGYSDEIPEQFKDMVFDYQVLQYDVLYGENFYGQLSATTGND